MLTFSTYAFTDLSRGSRNGYSQYNYFGSTQNHAFAIDTTGVSVNENIEKINNGFDKDIYNTAIITTSAKNPDNIIVFSEKLDDDDYTDIIVYDTVSTSIKYYEAQENFILLSTYNSGAITTYIEIIDVDNDGYDNIIFANATTMIILGFNRSTNSLYEYSTLEMPNINAIRCANVTGYLTDTMAIDGTGIACAMVQTNNSFYAYDPSFTTLYMNNISLCLSTQNPLQPNNRRMPFIITDLNDDDYFDIATICSDGGTSPQNTINTRIIDSSGSDILSSDVMVSGTASNICTNAGLKNYPLFLSVADIDGDDSNDIVMSGIFCDSAIDQRFQYYGIRAYNSAGTTIFSKDIQLRDSSICNAGTGNICTATRFMPPMIYDIDRTTLGSEICVGSNVERSTGQAVYPDSFQCFKSSSTIALFFNYSKTMFGSSYTGSYWNYLADHSADLNYGYDALWLSRYGVNHLSIYQELDGSFSKYSNDLLMPLYNTTATQYFFSIINQDYYYDIISVSTAGMRAYITEFENIPPLLIYKAKDTGNPVCLGSSVTFRLNATDSDDDLLSLYLDCGNGIIQSDLYNSVLNMPLTASCNYNDSGSFNPSYTINDTYSSINGSYDIITVIAGNPPNCYISGTGGGELTVSGDSGFDSIVSYINTLPSGLRYMIVLTVMALFFILGIIGSVVSPGIGKVAIAGAVILDMIVLIIAVSIGMIPLWVLILLIMIMSLGAIGLLYRIFNNPSTGQGG